MKKFLKYFLIFLLVIGLIVAGAASFIAIRGIPKYPVKHVDLKVEVTPERIVKGKKLASILCVKCHFDPNTNQLTGRQMDDVPEELGEVHSRNITQHKTKGIGSWTDGEIYVLLRTGLKRDGQYVPPYMTKLPHMSDEDMYSIIAWLHSDDPMLKPSAADYVESKPTFLTKFLCLVAFKPFELPKEKIVAPDTSNKVEYGKYLATAVLDCYQCHSQDFKTNDAMFPEKSKGFFGGGNKMLDHDHNTVVTGNLTPDKTGLGEWTEEQFVKTLRFGMRPDGRAIKYPMEPYTPLTEGEAAAIYAYLRTVPPISNNNNNLNN